MNLSHWLARRAALSPTSDALFRGTQRVADYRSFDAGARAVAGWLGSQGVGPGGRVAIFMHNDPAYLLAFYGIWMAGAVVVPINAKLHPKEAAYILRDSGAKLALVTPELGGGLAPETDLPLIDVSGDAAVIDEITVHWSTGGVDVLTDVAVNQILTVAILTIDVRNIR